jgi:hypothetical protein
MRSFLSLINRGQSSRTDENRLFVSVNPVPHAQNAATQIRQTNAKYSGQYDSENRRHGKGVLVLKSGHAYMGQWEHGELNGEGVHVCNNKRLFYGQWKDGKADGDGVHRFLNGDQYIGQFKAGQMHGVGQYTYRNGDQYYGEWKDNKRNGKGVLCRKYDKYHGQWKDSKRHGEGVYENFITAHIYKEVWHNGQNIEEKRIF